MNLAANARDAMPDGGTLEIAITAVELDDSFIFMATASRADMLF